MNSVAGSELLSALIVSSAFWLTIAGMALRMLRLDFKKLERQLEHFYRGLDQANFSALSATETAAKSTLVALYGSPARTLLVTALAAVVVNAYMLSLLYSDWSNRKDEISAIEARTVLAIDGEYAALISSEGGRTQLVHALDTQETDAGAYFVNNSPEDQRLRRIYARFTAGLEHFIAHNRRVAHDLTLARFFGRSLTNLAWQDSQWLQLLAMAAFMTAAAVVVDSAAVVAIRSLVTAALAGRIKHVFAMTLVTIVCFVLSLANAAALLAGHELMVGHLLVWLFLVILLILLIAVVVSVGLENGVSWGSIAAALLLLALFAGSMAAQAMALELSWSDVSGFLTHPMQDMRLATDLLGTGISPPAVLASAITLFPLLAVLSIGATIVVAKATFVALKQVVLGQVHGATIIAGSTYFLAFLTTIISCTTAAYILVRWLSNPSP
jgi:hypothetical protein